MNWLTVVVSRLSENQLKTPRSTAGNSRCAERLFEPVYLSRSTKQRHISADPRDLSYTPFEVLSTRRVAIDVTSTQLFPVAHAAELVLAVNNDAFARQSDKPSVCCLCQGTSRVGRCDMGKALLTHDMYGRCRRRLLSFQRSSLGMNPTMFCSTLFTVSARLSLTDQRSSIPSMVQWRARSSLD